MLTGGCHGGAIRDDAGAPPSRHSICHCKDYDVVFEGLIDVQSATLDEPDAIPAPTAQVQTAERIGWLQAGLASHAFERYPG